MREGDRLMQIDPQRQQAAVSSQEAERAARQANVTYARQQLQRASELFGAGAISKQELEQAETAVKTAQANLEALQAQVRRQEVQLRYYAVTAPTAWRACSSSSRVRPIPAPRTSRGGPRLPRPW